MPVHNAGSPTDVLGHPPFFYQLLSVPGAGYFSVSTPADRFGADPGDPFLAGRLVPPPCCHPAPAFSTWPAGAACPVPLHLTPLDGLCGVVPYTASAVHPTPPIWVSHWLAHASGLQWPASLGTPPTDDHMCGVFAHPGEPSAPNSAYSQAAGPLHGFPSGTTCALAGHTISSSTRPPSSCHQGLGCYTSY